MPERERILGPDPCWPGQDSLGTTLLSRAVSAGASLLPPPLQVSDPHPITPAPRPSASPRAVLPRPSLWPHSHHHVPSPHVQVSPQGNLNSSTTRSHTELAQRAPSRTPTPRGPRPFSPRNGMTSGVPGGDEDSQAQTHALPSPRRQSFRSIPGPSLKIRWGLYCDGGRSTSRCKCGVLRVATQATPNQLHSLPCPQPVQKPNVAPALDSSPGRVQGRGVRVRSHREPSDCQGG